MKPQTFWDMWLTSVSWLLIAFGAFIALGHQTALFEFIFGRWVNAAFGFAAMPAVLGWMYGVLGATVLGWGIFILFIVREAFARRERWAWWCLAVGLGMWFVPDTAFSVYYGVWVNVAVNLTTFALFFPPLWATRREFAAKR